MKFKDWGRIVDPEVGGSRPPNRTIISFNEIRLLIDVGLNRDPRQCRLMLRFAFRISALTLDP